MTDINKNILFYENLLKGIGGSDFPIPSGGIASGYLLDGFEKQVYDDYGITIIPSLEGTHIDDFSSILSSIQLSIPTLKEKYLDTQTEQPTDIVSPDSTNTVDINAVNRAYKTRLAEETDVFVQTLLRTDFEDGMENDLTEEVKGYIQDNALATYSWLAHIYSNNQKNENVIAGLLRIIAMDVEEEDYDDLLPIVKAGLSDYGSSAQEAAVMVIEKWRTKNCLDALQTAPIQTPWIRSYAKRVEKELIKELEHASSTDDI